jgi:glucose/arabinose dehydrogenase
MLNTLFGFFFIMVFIFASFNAGSAETPDAVNPVVGDPPQTIEDKFLPEPSEYDINTWVENLRIPWALVFLSEEKALVTERGGQIRLIENGKLQEEPYKIIDKVEHIGEGGLMGLAKHPDYPNQAYLYTMYTYREDGTLYNGVARYRDTGSTMEFDRMILEKIPGHRVHNGGRIKFGPDGMLYVCTGDIWQSEIAQDKDNLGGKILRLTPDGDIPKDNPFEGSPVYSLGHRNPQGLAWHPATGSLFSSEHGPSGEFGLSDKDIINVIKKGGNYGWPLVIGEANVEQYIDPIIMWSRATPPSGMTFWNGRLYVATLRSETLIRVDVEPEGGTYKVTNIDRLFANDWFSGIYGRLRDAVDGPDGALYVLTNNRDGRGTPHEGDDKILRLILR